MSTQNTKPKPEYNFKDYQFESLFDLSCLANGYPQVYGTQSLHEEMQELLRKYEPDFRSKSHG